MAVTKNRISVVTAAITGLTMISNVCNYNGSSEYMDGEIGYYPLVIDLDEAFFATGGICPTANPKPIDIASIKFTCDVNTSELPEYKAFCTQGILTYEDKNSEEATRTFCDCVPVDSKDYKEVAGKQSVRTTYSIGTKSSPLNMWVDDDNTMTLEFTWCTGTSLSISDMVFIDTKGKEYVLSEDAIYTVTLETSNDGGGKATDSRECKTQMPFNCDFYVSSIYGEYRGDNIYHWGVDLCSQGDYTIFATHPGYVEYADWENPYDPYQGFGQYVKIVGDNGYWYYYGHMSEIYVSEGDYVEAGQKIGYEGTTGSSTGDHCHYEIRDNGCPVNCLDPEIGIDIPNEYGMVYVNTEPEPEEMVGPVKPENVTPSSAGSNTGSVSEPSMELIQKCLSFNKWFEIGAYGKANTINLNDNGACSLGAIQARGELGRELIEQIRDENPEGFNSILAKYTGFSDPELDDYWENFYLVEGTDDERFISELLIQDWAVDTQWRFDCNVISRAIKKAQEAGVTDEDAIILYTRCYINAGCNSDSQQWILDHPKASVDEIFANINIMNQDSVEADFRNHSWKVITADDLKA